MLSQDGGVGSGNTILIRLTVWMDGINAGRLGKLIMSLVSDEDFNEVIEYEERLVVVVVVGCVGTIDGQRMYNTC